MQDNTGTSPPNLNGWVESRNEDAARFRRMRGYAHAPVRTSGPPNWDKWKHIPQAPLWKVACLSLGVEPSEDIFGDAIATKRRFPPGKPNLQDRLEILHANLSINGPIRPQKALYRGVLQDPKYPVLLSEVAAFLLTKEIQIPAEMAALAPTEEPDAEPEQETKEQRENRRLKMCEDAGLPMDKRALLRLPDGVGKQADIEGLSRQAFSDDVKNALKRKLERQREESGSR